MLLVGLALLVPVVPLLLGGKTFYIARAWVTPLAVMRDPALFQMLEAWLLASASALMLDYGARRYERIHRLAAVSDSTARRQAVDQVVAVGAALVWVIVTVSTLVPLVWLVLAGSGLFWQRIMAAAAILVASIPALTAAQQAHRYARRLAAIPLRSPDKLRTGRFVLYLRAFNEDKTGYNIAQPRFWFGILGSQGNTHEEFITTTFRQLGRVVAVGRPGEVHPFPGASRFYLPPNGWEPVVSDLMCRARLVLVVAGTGKGTLWEVTEAVRLLAPERLMLLIQGDRVKYESFRRAARSAIAGRLTELPPGERGPLASFTLPDFPKPRHQQTATGAIPLLRGVVRFDASWTPTFVSLDPASAGPYVATGVKFRLEEVLADLKRTLTPDEVPHSRRHPVRGWALHGAAMVLMGVVAAAAVGAVGLLFGLLGSGTLVVRFFVSISMLLACLVMAGLSKTTRRHARLHTGPVTETPGDEPYVLFVRPFPGEPMPWFGQPTISSTHRDTLMSRHDFAIEEELEKIFKPYGRLVCLGDPGDRQGLPAGTRLYLPPENWQAVTARAVDHARLVIMVPGTAKETAWVMNQAAQLLPPSRLLLIMHRDHGMYEKFREAMSGEVGAASRLNFPAYPYRQHERSDAVLPDIIHFDCAWQPKFLRLQRPDGTPVTGRRARRYMVRALLRPILKP